MIEYKIFRARQIVILAALFVYASSVIAEQTFVYPIVRQCREPLISNVKVLSRQNADFNYEVVDASWTLKSHPDITGFLVLESSKKNSTQLAELLLPIINACYPDDFVEIDRKKPDAWDELRRTIEYYERLRYFDHYVVVDRNKIRVYFSGRLVEKMRKTR